MIEYTLKTGKISYMRAEEFKAARKEIGLSQREWGIWLGYNNTENMRGHINQMESGLKPVRKVHALLIQAYLNGYRPNMDLDQ